MKQEEVFCFCFSSLSGAWVRRGPERSRARRGGARRSAPLRARTAATAFEREEKTAGLNHHYSMEDSRDRDQ